jgi:LacI family transcriptional regulator, galactose operon repressor
LLQVAVRLKDIAREIGVSTVTVSKVLRGRKDVSEKTRQRILNRMKELNYQPNVMARALIGGKTYSVGLVVPDLVHPFFAEFARSLSSALREGNRALILASSEEDPEIEKREIRALLNRRIDVLIIASCQTRLRNFFNLGEEQTPFFLVDRNFPYLNAHFVGSDDYKIGELATQHLVETGRKRIAHVGTDRISTGQERMRGYQAVLRHSGLELAREYVVMREKIEETADVAGFEAVRELLRLKHRPDAIFCYNDLTAVGGMQAVIEAGLRIPEDVAFVGCGNFRYADYLKIPLTSVDQHTAELGRAAGDLALRLAECPDQPIATSIIEPRLMVRASSRA